MQEKVSKPSIIIIGAGIAGLSAGIYAQRSGFQSQIFEMHTIPGGLMTAWKRKGFTIDGCIHWLTGSSPKSETFKYWQEIGLLQTGDLYVPEIYSRHETRDGKVLNFYTDIDRFEKELVAFGPEDEKYIHEFCEAARSIAKSRVFTGSSSPSSANFFISTVNRLKAMARIVSVLPQLRKWSGMTVTQFAAGFKSPTLREVFDPSSVSGVSDMSAMGMILPIALMHDRDGGYPLGGSLPMAQSVEKRYCELGGVIHYNSRVEKILVENDRAAGIRLSDGSEHRADYVISAADGHATIFDMLAGRYVDDKIKKIYNDYPLFSPILLVGLGVNRTFAELPGATGGISFALKEPVEIAGQKLNRLEAMIYNFDPTLAPEGKTVVTLTIPTSYSYWKELSSDRERYDAEKQKIALALMDRLDGRFPGFASQVEMADVATPMTFEHYTGNWQASFEGFLPTPKTVMASIPKTLPGLSNFYMAGQWVQAGGGLPSGLLTGRDVISRICKQDGRKFDQM
jgi:phytoene dehydrogenase-like protein